MQPPGRITDEAVQLVKDRNNNHMLSWQSRWFSCDEAQFPVFSAVQADVAN